MKLADTHCHLDFVRFDADRDAVLRRAWEAGLTRILIPGINPDSSRAAVRLAGSDPRLFAAVGIHPNDASDVKLSALNDLRKLAQHPKVKAIGEIGLDYHRQRTPPPLQRQVLREQLELAAELGLPVIIHLREENDAEEGAAAADLLESLEFFTTRLRAKKSPPGEQAGVLHSFSGSRETARAALRLGFSIGVSGPITYPNAAKRGGRIAGLPLERLLLETDAPFLAPQSHRGQRNEPAFIGEIADKIATLKSLGRENVAAATSANAKRLFSWEDVD